jgi:hypothetical protein
MPYAQLLLSVFVSALPAAPAPSEAWQGRTAVAQQMDIGESAPDWLVDSESYAIGGVNDWGALAESKVAFITHCPVNRDFFERCHALGVRCFPYVTFYQGFASMTYEGVNLKEHPEFIEVDANGDLKRTGFWESEDAKNMYTTCPNVAGYQDAMVAWVRKIMDLGADGVFVDNLSSRAECFGPKFGKHEHVYDDVNHAFAMLLKRVREVIREYKPDGAILGNSAYPPSLPKEFWKYIDAEMLESYICTWVSTERWFDWHTHWDKVGKELQPYLKAGKQIQALSYLGHTPYGVREDAYFCYATARLAGFVWNGGPLSSADCGELYRLRLGKALTDEIEENGVHYRVFERGFVAVNPEKDKTGKVSLASPMPTKRLVDLFGDGVASWLRYDKGGYAADYSVKHGGGRSIVCENTSADQASGAYQAFDLNQTSPTPILIGGWSKAENVSGTADGNYALYADIAYTDGSNLYGQIAPFEVGTHDWQSASVTIRPEKPVKGLTLYALFRYKTGKVWFDDVSLQQEGGGNLARNAGFEESSREPSSLDLTETGVLDVPSYSGRVYLFAPDNKDELAVKGPRLTVVTSPPLGEVRFRVDGFDYWTYSGRWTTEYTMGPDFGKFSIVFDKPGEHAVEIVDVVPADMKTSKGYGSGERLGQFMDPSNPTKPSEGKKFKFREWEGLGKGTQVSIDVSSDTKLIANFDVEQAGPTAK